MVGGDGKEQDVEIEESWIDDIVSAIQGQYTFVNNVKNFVIHGEFFVHVDIYWKKKEKETK